MTRIGRRALLPFLLLLGVDAASVKAQTESRQRLHVLRIDPGGAAEPTDSVVVTFDRPVAPRLDHSVDPVQALRVSPAAVSSSYWRDPSTLVVVFERPWAYGAEYRVDFAPTLRSADGRRLATGQARAVRVRPPRPLVLWPSLRADGEVATMQRPRVVLEGPLPLLSFVGRSWLVPYGCGWGRDSIALKPESIARLDTSDVQKLGARARDADEPMLDSLRRVVSFAADRELPRACSFVVSLSSESGSVDQHGHQTLHRTAPEFRLDSVGISRQYALDGHVVLHFTLPVSLSEVRRAVRVDGHAVTTVPSPFNANRPDTAARTQWFLTDSFAPGQRADVVVQADLRDVEGEALGAETHRTLERPHASPAVSQPSGLVVVPKDVGVLLVVNHVNVDSIAIDLARVPDLMRVALLQTSRWGSVQSWNQSRGETVTRTIAVTSGLDSTGTVSIPATLLPAEWRDDELILVRARGIPGATYQRIARWALPQTPHAIVQRTNLAAHVTTYMGRGEIWVTSLRTGDPVSHARVRVLDSNRVELTVATTDARGRARIDFHVADSPWAEKPLVEVTAGRERVMLTIEGMPRERIQDDDDRELSGASPRAIHDGTQLHGAAFSERGIYRPGERVFLKGVVRTFEPYGNFGTPAADSARWTIHQLGDAEAFAWRAKSEQVQRHGVVLTSFGTAVDTFDIPRTAPLGRYSASLALKTAEGWRTAATASFTVAEYRAVEFDLALDADTTIALFSGDTARLRASARYLFGMPMTGAMVSWGGNIEEGTSNIIGLRAVDGWRVGRTWWRLPAEPPPVWITPDSAPLDAAGTVAIAVPASTVWPTGRMHLVVTAADANRRTVTAERSLTVHAADAYVAMRTRSSRWYWNAGDTIPVDLTVARVNGERRAGADVDLTALRYEWHDREWRADTVWRGKARSSSAPVSAVFTPSEAGWYELLATAHDERGRATTTGLDLWVTGPRRAPHTEERRDLKITLDRERYAPGDVISAVLDSPLELRAWVSLSRSVPLNEQMVLLHPGPNVVSVRVPMEAIPSAELRVVGVSPLGLAGGDRQRYVFTAVSTIKVSSKSRELAVHVSSDRSSYAPGDSVRVHVQVAAPGGRAARAETTIWAVDQGVGLLTGLEKPNLLGMLLGTEVLSPSQRSTLDAYVLGLAPIPAMERNIQIRIRGMSSARREITGSVSSMYLEEVVVTAYGEQRAGAPLRRRFATTPLFAGSVVTDSAGMADVRFRLPDNVTTYRLFATAVSAGMEAGSGDTSLASTRPLVVRAALPRAVRIGDSLVAGGVLTQDADAVTPVSLHVETRGIDVRGAATRADTLRGRTARELRFPMRVVSGDSVMVRLRGGSTAMADAVELTLPVSPPGRPRAHVVSGTMEGRADVSLPAIEGIDVGRSSVTVQLGTSVLPLVRQLSDALRAYPYGCTEQLASAGRALLARLALARVKDPAATLEANDRRTLESIVSRIVARQEAEGGFGYWERDGWTSPWLTAYATELLIDARAEGVRVMESVTTDAANYLEREIPDDAALNVWTNRIGPAPSSHDLLASARVLRRLSRPSARLETALGRMRDRLPFVDELELARLRAMAGDSVAGRELLDAAWGAAHASGRKVALDDTTQSSGWLFESRLRAIATLTKATAELEPKHPLLGALLESLIQRGRAERDWQWNTLDQSATAEALAAVRSVYGFGEARRVDVMGASGKLATSTFEAGRSDSLGFPLATLVPSPTRGSAPRLGLVTNTQAPIYYAATLFETPRARPVRADDEGISVERWYEGYDDGKPTMSVREGQLVRVRLRVTVKGSREFVAVEDPLPAGLEAVDLNLRTSAALQPPAWARRAAASNGRTATRRQWAWWSPWEHTEMRDDRVLYFARTLGRGSWDISYVARATTAGVFVRPPAQAEEMYNPAVHGRSDGGWFTVTEATGR